MRLAGKAVQFWLSPSGYAEVGEVLNVQGPFEVVVVDQDDLGVWIRVRPGEELTDGADQVMLLKWAHFSTALTSFKVPEIEERPPAGFRPF
jgi:hypothetical protein